MWARWLQKVRWKHSSLSKMRKTSDSFQPRGPQDPGVSVVTHGTSEGSRMHGAAWERPKPKVACNAAVSALAQSTGWEEASDS